MSFDPYNPESINPAYGVIEPYNPRGMQSNPELSVPFLDDRLGAARNTLANQKASLPSVSRSPTSPSMGQRFNDAMGSFDSAMNTGAGYLSEGIGALAKPINSVLGAAMKPVGSVLETAMSPVNSIFGALNESPLGKMAVGFGQGVNKYQKRGQEFDFSGMSPEQLQQMIAAIEARINASGGAGGGQP